MSNRKLISKHNFKEKFDIYNGLKNTINWYKKNKKTYNNY